MFDVCPQLSVVACQVPEDWIALLEDNTGTGRPAGELSFSICGPANYSAFFVRVRRMA